MYFNRDFQSGPELKLKQSKLEPIELVNGPLTAPCHVNSSSAVICNYQRGIAQSWTFWNRNTCNSQRNLQQNEISGDHFEIVTYMYAVMWMQIIQTILLARMNDQVHIIFWGSIHVIISRAHGIMMSTNSMAKSVGLSEILVTLCIVGKYIKTTRYLLSIFRLNILWMWSPFVIYSIPMGYVPATPWSVYWCRLLVLKEWKMSSFTLWNVFSFVH